MIRVGLALLPFVLFGATCIPSSGATTKPVANIFTFKGRYHGTLKAAPTADNCTVGKQGSESYFWLNNMTGKIVGVKKGQWAFAGYEPKNGTYTTTQLVNSSEFITEFDVEPGTGFFQTSGTIKSDGDKGSLNIVMDYSPKPGVPASGVEDVTGSWNCPKAEKP
jgi:hypothetical protein